MKEDYYNRVDKKVDLGLPEFSPSLTEQFDELITKNAEDWKLRNAITDFIAYLRIFSSEAFHCSKRDEEFEFFGLMIQQYSISWNDETGGYHYVHLYEDGSGDWVTSSDSDKYKNCDELDFNVLTDDHEDIIMTIFKGDKK